jgi:hypothetical protein
MERNKEKVKLGLKSYDKFGLKMTMQSLFDNRAFITKIVHILKMPPVSKAIKAPRS